jgi:hypothetical protein
MSVFSHIFSSSAIVHTFWKPEGKNYMGDIRIVGRLVLKWMLKEEGLRM